jgi:hypothetical protein
MKKLLFVPALFLLAFLFFPKQTVLAGDCTCSVGASRSPFVTNNNCGSGFSPRCYFDGVNVTAPLLCACDSTGNNTSCGGKDQSCCNGTTCDVATPSLTCITFGGQAGTKCLTQEQIGKIPGMNPNGLPDQVGEIFCNGEKGINTAIGCIPIDENGLLSFLLKWAIGVGGGIAFLLIVYAGFMIMSSSGNPERLKAGQELLTSAIAGIIMLIFSVFILNVIGVKILNIPGFGGN